MRFASLISLGTTIVSLLGCAPSSAQLKRAVEADPDIVYAAFQKDPEKFLSVMTSLTTKGRAAEKLREIDELRKNRKTPVLTSDISFRGTEGAPIVIVEYSDMQCPYCGRGHEVITQLLAAYPGRVQVYLKHNPLQIHPMAVPAAELYEAIALQDKQKAAAFAEGIFEGLDALNSRGVVFLHSAVRMVGADLAAALRVNKAPSVAARIAADVAEAKLLGFSMTPSFLVNGVQIIGAQPIETFKKLIDRELASK